jgi:hypothetical protein
MLDEVHIHLIVKHGTFTVNHHYAKHPIVKTQCRLRTMIELVFFHMYAITQL